MEQQRRFDGMPYPVGMAPFPFRLKGQGFFPGGDGLWRDEQGLFDASKGSISTDGILFLGNDFGTLKSYLKLQPAGYENVPTWRNVKKRAVGAGLPTDSLFFTNTILGLREEGSALSKQSWKKMPRFANFCGEFLNFQLAAIRPRLVVIMGPDARVSFDAFAKASYKGEVLYTTHPYGDFNFSPQRLAEDVEILRKKWQDIQ